MSLFERIGGAGAADAAMNFFYRKELIDAVVERLAPSGVAQIAALAGSVKADVLNQ
jgi:hypothetical protein